MTTITETIPGLGSVPTTADPATFDARADTLLGTSLPATISSMNTMAGQMNTVAGEVAENAAATADASQAAVAAANFKGSWSSLAGSLAIPASASHLSKVWMLTENVADVTAEVPGTSAKWISLTQDAASLPIAERTANSILVAADVGTLIKITANTFTQTITAAATLGARWFVYYQNAGTGTITLDPDGSETINGAATLVVGSGQFVILSCDGTNFNASVLASYVGDHHVLVTTGNGTASTNSKIRIFTTIQSSSGTAITYATSGTAGNSFTINEDGLYEVSYVDGSSTDTATAGFGISLNSNQLTTGVDSITAAHRIAFTSVYGYSGPGNGAACVTRTLRLSAGDVVRAHVGSGNPLNTTSASSSQFSITKVGV